MLFKSFINRSLAVLLLSFVISTCYSQNHFFKNYSLDEGISQSEISCFYEDSRGYLWVGTKGGGVNRFDGKRFVSYDSKNGICAQMINAICEDSEGNMIFGTSTGDVCVYDGLEFKPLVLDIQKKLNAPIIGIEADVNGGIVVATYSAVWSVKNGVLKKIELESNVSQINSLFKANDNTIWIATSTGIFSIRNGIVKNESTTLNDVSIKIINADKNGNIFVVTSDNKVFRSRSPRQPIIFSEFVQSSAFIGSNTMISDIHFDLIGQLWISTYNEGIYLHSKNEVVHFNRDNYLPVLSINTIYEDRTGIIWIGTSGAGVLAYIKQEFSSLEKFEGLSSPDIFSFAEDKVGNIWIGTATSGLYKYNGKTSERIKDNALVGESVRTLFAGVDGEVLVGGSKGLYCIENNNNRVTRIVSASDSLKNIRAIYRDKNNVVWIGTSGAGLWTYKNRKVSKSTYNIRYAYSFAEGKSGGLFIGTNNGICEIKVDKNVKYYDPKEYEFCNSYFGSVVRDRLGDLWFGTDECVVRYDGKSFKNIGVNQGLASGTVYLVNSDLNGDIWVGTNKGVDRIVLGDKGEIVSVKNYSRNEGFKGVECNSRSTLLDSKGNIWFGTIKGALFYNPNIEFKKPSEKPFIHIDKISLGLQNVDWRAYTLDSLDWFGLPKQLKLKYSDNDISFEFSGISKRYPENISYSFKLEGYDKYWSQENNIHSASYTNLPGGDYVFKVRAKNTIGIWSDEKEYRFTIQIPIWKSLFFQMALILASFFGLYIFFNKRAANQKQITKTLEKIVAERTSEINKKNAENQVLLKEVHHRVKNNLQIISSLITLQSDYVKDNDSLLLFEELKYRMRSIALVHEQLYQSNDYTQIDIKSYLKKLITNLSETFNSNDRVEVDLQVEVTYLNLNYIVPFGLLVNEIISNSYKYAFPDNSKGRIHVRLTAISNINYILFIGDDGKGYDDKIFSEPQNSLGIELIKILTEQLNGTIEKVPHKGTNYKISFNPTKIG